MACSSQGMVKYACMCTRCRVFMFCVFISAKGVKENETERGKELSVCFIRRLYEQDLGGGMKVIMSLFDDDT